MIGHVLDAGKDYDKPSHRSYQTNVTMDYHVGQCDVVCLSWRQTAWSGGQSKLDSSVAVYNEDLARRPDLITVLSQPFHWTRHGEIGPGQHSWYIHPVLNFLGDYLCNSRGQKTSKNVICYQTHPISRRNKWKLFAKICAQRSHLKRAIFNCLPMRLPCKRAQPVKIGPRLQGADICGDSGFLCLISGHAHPVLKIGKRAWRWLE